MNPESRTRVALGVFGLVLLVVAFNLADWSFKVRFTHPALNYWFTALLSVALPTSLAAAIWSIKRKLVRVLGLVLSLLLAVPAFIFALLAGYEAIRIQEQGHDGSFELLSEVASGSNAYRLYLTNCGATCAFGLELQRELDTPMGLKIVWPLWSKYRTDPNATLRLESENEVQVIENGALVASVAI